MRFIRAYLSLCQGHRSYWSSYLTEPWSNLLEYWEWSIVHKLNSENVWLTRILGDIFISAESCNQCFSHVSSQRSFWKSRWTRRRKVYRLLDKKLRFQCSSDILPCSSDTHLSKSFHQYHTLNFFVDNFSFISWETTWGINFWAEHHARLNQSAFTVIIFPNNIRIFRVSKIEFPL